MSLSQATPWSGAPRWLCQQSPPFDLVRSFPIGVGLAARLTLISLKRNQSLEVSDGCAAL